MAFLSVLLLLALPALAQIESPASGDDTGAATAEDTASQQAYGGPSLLSRNYSSSLGTPRIELTPYVEITGVYDSGLDGVLLTSPAGKRNTAAFGAQYTLGLSSARSWRHTQLRFNYGGSVARRFGSNAYGTSSQSLSLGMIHLLSAHTALTVNGVASAYSRSFTQPSLSSDYLPALDVYGNRTTAFATQIALTVQKSARLSFSLGGNGGLTHQQSNLVSDIGSIGATADAQYRLSRRATIGVSYMFSNYLYPGASNTANFHNVSGNYALALSRRTEFSLSSGFLKSESNYLQMIPLDPTLAYLIGAPAAMVINHRVSYLPSGSGRISRSFNRGSASFSGGYTVRPGNGLYLAMVATTLSGDYTYTGLRKWGLSAGGSYSKGKSMGSEPGGYGTLGANFSASRPLGRLTHFLIGFSAIQYHSPDVAYYNRLSYQARIGLGISPGNIPLGPR